MSVFQLHPQLQQDCHEVGRFELSLLLMMNDSAYPWFILVPQRGGLTELYQLNDRERTLWLAESCQLAETMAAIFRPDKLNVAAIGNLVPQLHIHHIARYRTDPAWPAPVWGKFPAQPYTGDQAERRIGQMRQALRGRLLD